MRAAAYCSILHYAAGAEQASGVTARVFTKDNLFLRFRDFR